MVNRARTLYTDGHTQTEIAKLLGTTQKIIWNLMRRSGIKARIAAKRNQRGPNNHMWKGGGAKYAALHLRVAAVRGQPKQCMECGSSDQRKKYEWASTTGDYTNPYDYKRLCKSCHAKFDQVIFNIKHMRKEVSDA